MYLSEFIEKNHSIVSRATDALEHLTAQAKDVRNKLTQEELGATAAATQQAEIETSRHATITSALTDLDKVHTDYQTELANSHIIDASMLHEDAQLFQITGLELTDEQFTALAEKHRDNPLMVELMRDYQRKHPELYTHVALPTLEYKKETATYFTEAAKRAVRYPDTIQAALFLDGKLDPTP